MIHFDVVDFNECRSEVVISFFWHSVYLIMLLYSGILYEDLYLYIYLYNIMFPLYLCYHLNGNFLFFLFGEDTNKWICICIGICI